MMSVRLWRNVYDLCAMYEMVHSRAGEDFVGLVDVCAYYAHRGGYDLNAIVDRLCEQMHLSKVVYWSRLKRAAAPLLHADVRTLQHLGVKISRQPQNTADLVRALVETVKDDDFYEEDFDV